MSAAAVLRVTLAPFIQRPGGSPPSLGVRADDVSVECPLLHYQSLTDRSLAPHIASEAGPKQQVCG